MKYVRRTLGFATLALFVGVNAVAAEPKAPVRKRAPAQRQVETPAPVPLTPAEIAASEEAEEAAQVVYQVLLAEIALQRGDLELATKAYSSLALRTRDPKILERTVEVAGYARRFDLALETTRLWLDVEPSSKRAQQLLVSILVMTNQLDEVAPILVKLLEADKPALADNLLGLNRMFARTPDRLAVYRLIDKVCQPFFGLAEAHYAVATAAASAGLTERGLSEVRRALDLRPDWDAAVFLQAQLLSRDSPGQAIAFLEDYVERYPEAREVRLHLARALIGEKRYADAKRHFDRLLKDYPDSADVVYPVAILALQQGDVALAEAQLRRLLTLDVPNKSVAYYYLGQIAEDKKRPDEALSFYSQVGEGERYIPSQLRRAHILAEQGKLDQARALLRETKASSQDESLQLSIAEAGLLREAKQPQAAFDLLDGLLTADPEQPDLLYETALLAEKINRLDVLETRLRKLIELKPDSAQAYNALGYSYADRNMRLPEARQLIEKALELSPDDHFILDSMGWVLFRQGDLPAALDYLQRAYKQNEDPDVAAHLGEVLWAMGRKDEARQTLRGLMQKYPNNDALNEAVRKFGQ